MQAKYFLIIFVTTLFFLSCGDEKKALEAGKKIENLRIRICVQGCELKFSSCLDKILEALSQANLCLKVKRKLMSANWTLRNVIIHV